MEKLQFILNSTSAVQPSKSTENSVGFDLYNSEPVLILPHSRRIIETDLMIKPPEGHFIKIESRSGIAKKFNVHVGAGIIDPDYIDTIKICLINLSKFPVSFKKNKKIAQFVCYKICNPFLEQVNNLENTVRGTKGGICE